MRGSASLNRAMHMLRCHVAVRRVDGAPALRLLLRLHVGDQLFILGQVVLTAATAMRLVAGCALR